MKRKKLVTVILAVITLLVLSSFSVMAADPEDGEGEGEGQTVEWTTADFTYSEDGTTITGLTESGVEKRSQTTVMVLPDQSTEDIVVTKIGDAEGAGGVFGLNDSASTITEVVLPNQLEIIGQNAFREGGLTKVDFPETLKEIGMTAFQMNQLVEIILPDSVTTVGSGAFASNDTVEKVKISSGMTSIPASFVAIATAGAAEKFTQVEIPDGITSIGSRAFSGNSFTSVTIPASVKTIDTYAFSQGAGKGTITQVNLNEGLESIKSNAFAQCPISSVDLPTTVTTLHKDAFKLAPSVVKVCVTNKEQLTATKTFILDGSAHRVVWKDSEELAAYKETSKNELDNYKNKDLYDAAQQTEISDIIDGVTVEFERCCDEETVDAVVAETKLSLDAVQTSKQIAAEAAIQEAMEAKEAATTEAELAAAELVLAEAYQAKAEADLEAVLAIKESTEGTDARVEILLAEAYQAKAEADRQVSDAKAVIAEAAQKEAEEKAAAAEAAQKEAEEKAAAAEAAQKEAEEKAAAAEAAQKEAEEKAAAAEKKAEEAAQKAEEAQNAQKEAEATVASANEKYKTPGAVQTLKVKAGKKKATLTWTKAESADGYRIYRATSKDGKYKLVKTVKGGDSVKYVNKKLKSGKKYYYKVRAYRKVPSGRIFSKATGAKKVKVK